MFSTMSLRCLVILCLFVTSQSALIKKRHIPVEIVYDRSNLANYGTRNLDEKVQLSQDELLKLKLSDDIINEGLQQMTELHLDEIKNVNGVRNLDEKIQLSPSELGQALKNVPNAANSEELTKSTEAVPGNNSENSESTLSLLTRAEKVVYAGINTIRKNIDQVAGNKPSQQAWENLNKTLETFFNNQYKNLNVKQSSETSNNENNQNNQNNQNNNEFLQNLAGGIVNVANQFMTTYFPQNNQKPNGTEDEQQAQGPDFFQGIGNMFQGGVNQVISIVSNLNGQNNNSTGQEDTGTQEQGGNFIESAINNIQLFFQNQNPFSPSQTLNNNQSDTGVGPSTSSPNVIQGAFNQFNSFVNNVFSPATQKPVQGDEYTSTTQAPNFIQNIGSALQSINFFGQSSTQSPQSGSNPASNLISAGTGVINQLQQQGTGGGSGGQQIGQQLEQVGAQGSNLIASGAEAAQQLGGYIPSPENVGNQIQQLGNGGNVGNQIQQLVGNQTASNPLQSIQNAISGATYSSTEKSKSGEIMSNEEKVTQSLILDEKKEKSEEVTAMP